jgi:3-hydroxybutyryl-CoA dehydratase
MKGKTISEITIGMTDSFQKTITETDVIIYSGITGDLNPAHINDEYARSSMFKERICHGMLTAGLISSVLGMKLPGPGSIYLGQTLKFTFPVRIGDTIKAIVSVKEINIDKNKVVLETICENQNKEIVLKGEAIVMPPKEEKNEL